MSARALASSTIGAPDLYAVDQLAVTTFNDQGLDHADWQLWKSYFQQERQTLIQAKNQAAPSTRLKTPPPPPAVFTRRGNGGRLRMVAGLERGN